LGTVALQPAFAGVHEPLDQGPGVLLPHGMQLQGSEAATTA
jgi:hypothetical protein